MRKCGQLYEISGLHPYGNAGRVYVRSGFPVRKFLDYAAIVPEVGKLLLNTVEIEKAFLAGRRYNERA